MSETTRVTMADIQQVFYVPGEPGIIDAVHPITGRGLYGGRSLEDIRRTNPGVIVASWDEAIKADEDRLRAGPVRITAEQWMESLEVLPPLGWSHTAEGETFKCREMTGGRITAIFCRIGDEYFALSDVVTMPHAEIVKACEAVRSAS